MRIVSKAIPLALTLAAITLGGCSDASQAWFQSRADGLAAMATKVKALAPAYCKIRPETSLDDLALAAIALATSEKAADTIKSGVTKVCEWVGVPSQQAAD